MKGVLVEMLKIYKPNGIDWMGYHMTNKNPYTYHHINEKRKGGPTTIENGAILTLEAHTYLNYLDNHYNAAYQAYQCIFREINASKEPVSKEMYERIKNLQRRIDEDILPHFEDNNFNSNKDSRAKKKEKRFLRREQRRILNNVMKCYNQR